jgi:hypothetical protein
MKIHFLGEQDGASEQELKQKLVELLSGVKIIKAAYLAIADYQDGSAPSIVLCLRSERGADTELVGSIGEIFSSMFNAEEHLDVLFANENEENELREVCRPFYSSQDM